MTKKKLSPLLAKPPRIRKPSGKRKTSKREPIIPTHAGPLTDVQFRELLANLAQMATGGAHVKPSDLAATLLATGGTVSPARNPAESYAKFSKSRATIVLDFTDNEANFHTFESKPADLIMAISLIADHLVKMSGRKVVS
jgi:hypothetical protein